MADIKYLVGLDVDGNINLNTNELQFASIHPLAANPSSPAPSIGQTYWNTGSDELRVYNGSVWIAVGADTNYSQWQITDGSQTDDVTTDQVVKFAANATAGAAGAVLTGTGTTGDPYLVTYTFPNDDTTYSADVGLTLAGTAFSVNVADSQTTQAPQSITTTTNRLYQVETDDTDHLVVNVPWTDANDNTTYDISWDENNPSVNLVLTPSTGTATTLSIDDTTNIQWGTNAGGTITSAYLVDDPIIAGNLTVNGTGQHSFAGQVTIPVTPVVGTDAASKAYVDGLVSGGLTFKGTFRADTGLILSGINSGSYLYNCPGGAGTRVAVDVGDYYVVAAAGGQFYCSGDQLDIGDSIIGVSTAGADSSVASDWSIVQSDEGVVSLEAATANELLGINVDQSTGNVKVGLDIDGLTWAGSMVSADRASIKIPVYDGDADDRNEYIELDQVFTTKSTSLLIGNGSATSIDLQNTGATGANKNHGLGTTSDGFIIQLVETSSGETVHAEVTRKASGVVTIAFNTAPASNGIRVLIQNVG